MDLEQQNLLDSLRNKYQNNGPQTAVSNAVQKLEQKCRVEEKSQNSAAFTSANGDMNIKVVLCPACDGEKVIKELYGPRVMERCCDKCEGEGCLRYKNGEQIHDHHTIPRNTRKGNSQQQGGLQNNSPENEFKKLCKLIYKYKKEVKELQRKITANTPEAEEKLIHGVIFEIQKHLEKLEIMKQKFRQQEQLPDEPFNAENVIKEEDCVLINEAIDV